MGFTQVSSPAGNKGVDIGEPCNKCGSRGAVFHVATELGWLAIALCESHYYMVDEAITELNQDGINAVRELSGKSSTEDNSPQPKLYRVEDANGTVVVLEGKLNILEICYVCYKQGAIYKAHPQIEDHKGCPSFNRWKPSAEDFRRFAERLETEG